MRSVQKIVKSIIYIILMTMSLAACGEIRDDPPRPYDARAMITLSGPLGPPLSDRLHQDFAGIIAAIKPVGLTADYGEVRLRWFYKGQLVQAESERSVAYDPLKGLDEKAIERIAYGTGKTINIEYHGARMKDGKVIVPATESKPIVVDTDFQLSDAAEIQAIVACLRTKSFQEFKMVARRALKLSDGTLIPADVREEVAWRTWSGNPGFRIYFRDQKGFVLLQGLLSTGEFADFYNEELNQLMRSFAEKRGDPPDRAFRDY